MAFVSFCSENYLKEFTPMNNNIDVKDILPHLQLAEEIWARELLGNDFYVDLKAKFIAQTLAGLEIDLVALLKPMIAYRCAFEAIPFLSTKMRNGGIVKLKGDNFDAAPLTEVKYLRDELANRSEYYATRISQFLCDNASIFPLYRWAMDNNPSPNNTSDWDSDVYLEDPYYLKNYKYYGKDKNA
jgi:hypothetical protein